MSDEGAVSSERPPWHLWVVGVLGLLWSVGGAFDYLMTQTRNESYMSRFTPEQLDYFYGIPAWAVAFWALAVWGEVLGTLLLLLRKRIAAVVLLVSLLSMVINSIYSFIMSNGMEAMGGLGPLLFTGLIFVFALGLWLYARAMVERGVLT
jgi:hypothetical protein